MNDEQRKHKEPIEMTTEEAVEFFFPPEAVEHLKTVACQYDEQKPEDAPSQSAPPPLDS